MTENYTPELHARLRELHQQASPAPWRFTEGEGLVSAIYQMGKNGGLIAYDLVGNELYFDDHDDLGDNEKLLIELRNALPALLNEIERLQNELETALPEAWKNGYADCLCDIEAVYDIDRGAITHKTADPYEEQK